jgi:hypothetical protein
MSSAWGSAWSGLGSTSPWGVSWGGSPFQGSGAHVWPPRSNDARWTQIISDSAITQSGNFIDDVHQALEALCSTTGAMDDLWKKFKALYNFNDTSEPFDTL